MKMKASQEVCNDTMMALWEECKPCLKQTCMKFYARVCRSGSGMVGRQVRSGNAARGQPRLCVGVRRPNGSASAILPPVPMCGSSRAPAGCPALQLNSDTASLEIASDPTGGGPSPTRLPHTRFRRSSQAQVVTCVLTFRL